mmetsp:Transcript_22861/g.34864  ORF Transcript_22861/g.34864 Transcript_22861/m.34864 type:complete len:90 (+) Transcript_22861:69-338(+)
MVPNWIISRFAAEIILLEKIVARYQLTILDSVEFRPRLFDNNNFLLKTDLSAMCAVSTGDHRTNTFVIFRCNRNDTDCFMFGNPINQFR